MSVQALTWVIEHSEATGGARCLMFAIANHADQGGHRCWASVETLAHEARMTPRGARAALRRLEGQGEIQDTGPSEFGTHVYDITGMGGEESSAPPGEAGDTRGGSSRHENGSDLPPNRPSKPSIEPPPPISPPTEFEEWLADHERVTGHSPPRAGTKAREALEASYYARHSEGWTAEELRIATRGAHEDGFRRENGYDVADSVLRPTKVGRLVARGQMIGSSRQLGELVRTGE